MLIFFSLSNSFFFLFWLCVPVRKLERVHFILMLSDSDVCTMYFVVSRLYYTSKYNTQIYTDTYILKVQIMLKLVSWIYITIFIYIYYIHNCTQIYIIHILQMHCICYLYVYITYIFVAHDAHTNARTYTRIFI